MYINKVVSIKKVSEYVKSGMTIMSGGFGAVGEAINILNVIADEKIKELTMIGVDAGVAGKGGRERLVREGHVSHLITSHMGLNPAAALLQSNGKLEVTLVPMGTLVEQIRCGGFGLGGVLTQTGLGTVVEDKKRIIDIDGKRFLLERPLRADVAIIKAWKADTSGNLVYRRTAQNFNPIMAMAADFVVVEAEEIVAVGDIDPDHVTTPGVCVDMIVKG